MTEHTPAPWSIYDDSDPHHIKIKGVRPDIGSAHVADVLFPSNTAFLLKAVNNHEALVEALKLARARIEYLGAAASNEKHFLANQNEFLPKIDAALAAVSRSGSQYNAGGERQ